MKNLKAILGIGLAAIGLTGLFYGISNASTVYMPAPRYNSSLAAKLDTNTTSSMILVSGVDGNGMTLSGPMCFSIDTGNTGLVEDVCGTASGTTVSNLLRGIDSTGMNASTTLARSHRVGANVQITNSPYEMQYYEFLNGIASFPNALIYAANITTSTLGSGSTQALASVAYANSLSYNGAPNGTTAVKGIYQEATKAQLASGTIVGSTGADLALTTNVASSSATANTVVLTNPSGTIDKSFLNKQNYTLGSTTVDSITSASTTLNGTTTASGTIILNGATLPAPTFGGTGASGTLSLSGTSTLTLNVGGAQVFERDYTSISLTQSSTLSFSNPSSNGTIVILKSQGNCTITGASTTISLVGMGATTSNDGIGLISGPSAPFGFNFSVTAGTSLTAGAIGGIGVHMSGSSTNPVNVFSGAGGSSGAALSGSTAGAGGIGGGGLLIECGGTLTFTSSTITVAGSTGTNGGGSASGGGFLQSGAGGGSNAQGGAGVTGYTSGSGALGGGGGGGGAGSAIIIAHSISANTGTVVVSGGPGGSGSESGASGGNGISIISTSTLYN